MKSKVVLNALALLFAAGAMAQDCTFFFPQTKGTQLVKKGYDAKGNLQSVMTYTVDEVKNIPSGLEVEADYVFKNSAGTVYDKGDLEAFCRDGEFFIEMKETLSNPSFVSTIQSDLAATEAVINYPSVSNAPSNNGDDMYFDDATIRPSSLIWLLPKQSLTIRVYRTLRPIMATICISMMQPFRSTRRRIGRIAKTCLSTTANM